MVHIFFCDLLCDLWLLSKISKLFLAKEIFKKNEWCKTWLLAIIKETWTSNNKHVQCLMTENATLLYLLHGVLDLHVFLKLGHNLVTYSLKEVSTVFYFYFYLSSRVLTMPFHLFFCYITKVAFNILTFTTPQFTLSYLRLLLGLLDFDLYLKNNQKFVINSKETGFFTYDLLPIYLLL